MYKVLIADDNALIRKSIIKRVPWELLDMECIGEAENGKETADMILRMQPDIVITDIKMPVADGFFAIQETKDRFPNLQFIIISGYDDFAYLKQSIQFQVLNYILKPIDTEELIDSLKKAARRCESSKTDHSYRQLYDRQQTEDAFYRFLSGETDFHAFAERLTGLHYPLLNSGYHCICLNWTSETQDADILSRPKLAELEAQLEALFPLSSCRMLRMHSNTFLLMMSHTGPFQLSSGLKQTLYDYFLKNSPGDAMLWMSCSEPTGLQRLPAAYGEALQLLLRRFIEPACETRIFSAGTAVVSMEFPVSAPEQELALVLELRMYEECKRLIRRIVEKAAASFELFCAGMPHFLDFLDVHLARITGKPVLPRQKRELYLLQYSDCPHLADALCLLIDRFPQDTVMDTAEQILLYIRGNYRSPLTLQQLSELFYVNPIYLGQLIKKQTGKPFNVFLNELRLTEAKKLILQEPEISLTNLAFSLGYTDAHYFTKVFKRYYGVTPSALKQEALKP